MNLPENLIIGFDAKRAFVNNTGLGNYSRLVIDSVAAARPRWELMLLTPANRAGDRISPILSAHSNIKTATPHGCMKAVKPLWRSFGITAELSRLNVGLFHGLSNELPLNIRRSRVPSVVTIHDLIFRRFPDNYNYPDRLIYDYKFKKAAIDADRVIAVSRRTRDDITELYGISPDKIDIVYQGCDSRFMNSISPDDVETVRLKYGLSNPYIIGVGTVEIRKNQLLTLKALRGLPREIHAVIVGRRSRGYGEVLDRYIRENGLAGRVHFLENAVFDDFPALYAGALLSSYPSRYEGFGIPVIESINAGTPVIVASGSCLEEAAGPDMPVVSPDDDEAFVSAALEIIDDQAYRADLVRRGREYVKRFNHEDFTRKIGRAHV